MKYLFIGGSLDGEWHEADGSSECDVSFGSMGLETYTRCRLADLDNCDRIEHVVYRYKDDDVKPLDKLIQGYSKRYTPKNEKV